MNKYGKSTLLDKSIRVGKKIWIKKKKTIIKTIWMFKNKLTLYQRNTIHDDIPINNAINIDALFYTISQFIYERISLLQTAIDKQTISKWIWKSCCKIWSLFFFVFSRHEDNKFELCKFLCVRNICCCFVARFDDLSEISLLRSCFQWIFFTIFVTIFTASSYIFLLAYCYTFSLHFQA